MAWLDLATMLAAASPPTGLLAVAVWRFARLEGSVKHQTACQMRLVRAVARVNVRQKRIETKLDLHLEGQ